MSGFRWVAEIDHTDIAGLVIADGTIDYGRASVFEQPGLPTAILELITIDADPTVEDLWPEFGLANSPAVSGFTDTYAATYAGPDSRVTLAASVVLTAVTDSGFTDGYADAYQGENLTRFTGIINAIDYTPDTIRLTCVPVVEAWSRVEVGGTDDVTTIPAETDTARVSRYCTQAGVDITIDGAAGPTLPEVPINTTADDLLTQLRAVATAGGGLLYVTRLGDVVYRSAAGIAAAAAAVTEIPDTATLLEPVAMSLELGLVRNRIIVEYGVADPDTGVRPSIMVEDTDSQALYGLRIARYTTTLTDPDDVTAYAEWLLASLDAAWHMPNATFALRYATDPQISTVAALEQGHTVTIPTLLTGSPLGSYTSPILGYTERLSASDWQIDYHLAPSSAPIPGATP